jgi:hypothetical protein
MISFIVNANSIMITTTFQIHTHSGSIFSIILRLLSLELSACLKNLIINVLHIISRWGQAKCTSSRCGSSESEVVPPRRELNQPLRVDGDALVHVSSCACYKPKKKTGIMMVTGQKEEQKENICHLLFGCFHEGVKCDPLRVLVVPTFAITNVKTNSTIVNIA